MRLPFACLLYRLREEEPKLASIDFHGRALDLLDLSEVSLCSWSVLWAFSFQLCARMEMVGKHLGLMGIADSAQWSKTKQCMLGPVLDKKH